MEHIQPHSVIAFFFKYSILSTNIRWEKNPRPLNITKYLNIDRTSVKLMSHLRKMTKLTNWKSDKN